MDEAKNAQNREQAMRDARDRRTRGPKGGQGEPRYRKGVDASGLGTKGWTEEPGGEPAPGGGWPRRPAADKARSD